MSDAPAQEPTMEEILASIRRIISEDEAQPSAEAHASEGAPAEDTGDDVLELTHKAEPEAPPHAAAGIPSLQALGDLDVSERSAPEPAPPAPSAAAPAAAPIAAGATAAPAAPREDAWVGEHTATAAAAHFGTLAQSLAMPAQGRTLEDLVRELLRPMLKEWLDQHLPQIVEARVQAEVERVSRGGGRY